MRYAEPANSASVTAESLRLVSWPAAKVGGTTARVVPFGAIFYLAMILKATFGGNDHGKLQRSGPEKAGERY